MNEAAFLEGVDGKSAFPALSILTTLPQSPGSVNGQAILNKHDAACSPVHEALHLTWEKAKYSEARSSVSSSSDQELCNDEQLRSVILRRHPSHLQRDAFQNIRSPTDMIRRTSSSSMIKACFVVSSSPGGPSGEDTEIVKEITIDANNKE